MCRVALLFDVSCSVVILMCRVRGIVSCNGGIIMCRVKGVF